MHLAVIFVVWFHLFIVAQSDLVPSPVFISFSGLWLRLWCSDLGQWLWVCADYPGSSKWKHTGGLCGVLPPAWQGKCWLHTQTHSHTQFLFFRVARRHYQLHWSKKVHLALRLLLSCTAHALLSLLCCSPAPLPHLPLSRGNGCAKALMGWVMLWWWTQLFIFRLLHRTETQSASLNLFLPTQTNATRWEWMLVF